MSDKQPNTSKENNKDNKACEAHFSVRDNFIAQKIAGPHHIFIELLQEECNVTIHERAPDFFILGTSKDAVDSVVAIMESLAEMIEKDEDKDIDSGLILRLLKNQESGFTPRAEVVLKRKTIKPRTKNQEKYINAIREHDMVFGLGDAGTGKTYLAVACALEQLEKGKVQRIILTRPAIEAGERLGFLPGDMKDKVAPYLQPLFDAIRDMSPDQDAVISAQMNSEEPQKQQGGHSTKPPSIEIAPLAFMRGRTLSNSVVILDEAQNTTCEQMKMFLTRLGDNSKMVIAGDPSQIDLPASAKSGLIQAIEILKGEKGIEFIEFDEHDVQRHPLVGRIVRAYKKANDHNKTNKS